MGPTAIHEILIRCTAAGSVIVPWHHVDVLHVHKGTNDLVRLKEGLVECHLLPACGMSRCEPRN